MTARGNHGFTLIELLIVVCLIGIICAIAMPSLLRARMAGNEGSAIGSLRSINSAQSTFAASCGSGFYSPTLVLLGTAPDATGDAYIGTDLNTDPAFKSTYEMILTAGAVATGAPATCNGGAAGTVVASYSASAAPRNTGFRFFGTNQGGTIYQGQALLPPTQFGQPAGSRPIE